MFFLLKLISYLNCPSLTFRMLSIFEFMSSRGTYLSLTFARQASKSSQLIGVNWLIHLKQLFASLSVIAIQLTRPKGGMGSGRSL